MDDNKTTSLGSLYNPDNTNTPRKESDTQKTAGDSGKQASAPANQTEVPDLNISKNREVAPQNPNASVPVQPTAPIGDKPTVRTMKSDIEKLFKSPSPSLIQTAGKIPPPAAPQSSLPARQPSSKKNLIVFLILLVLILAGAAGLTYYTNYIAPPPPPPPPAPFVTPKPFFQVEKTTVISGTPDKPASIFEAIQTAARTSEPEGTITYIPIKLQDKTRERFAALGDFVQLYHLNAPEELPVAANDPVMPFLYYSSDGARFGLAFQSRDPDRTLHDLLLWEPLLLTDMASFFFGEKYDTATAPFSDNTFRNIDWRFLNLSQDKDLGIAYMLFPSKQLFILTTSRGAIETAINRLYEKL